MSNVPDIDVGKIGEVSKCKICTLNDTFNAIVKG